MNTYHIYIARMSPTLNRSFALEQFEHSNVSKIRNRIMFGVHLGLPHMIYDREFSHVMAALVLTPHTDTYVYCTHV